MKLNIFWFRRDLRLEDNTALNHALSSDLPVLSLFIFDANITDELPADDARINFIHETLFSLNKEIIKQGGSVCVKKGDPEEIWTKLIASYDVNAVYVNKDYEPYAVERDKKIESILKRHQISFFPFKDQLIFEEGEILKPDKRPYTIFTPYKNRWLKLWNECLADNHDLPTKKHKNYYHHTYPFPELWETGFTKSVLKVRSYDLTVIPEYHIFRDIPSADRTSYLSPHLRFGTVSIRKMVKVASEQNKAFLNEMIWREFFMQILFHFPNVVTGNFKSHYDDIQWRNDEKDFGRWCNGETGYPMVDAGMRQLNSTGYMHNRVRMIVSGFLCKHLLIDWRWGEAYFAQKLLDYELSSNNGNWQWAAGTGCDAAPYFRIFNPDTQQKKFDPHKEYIRRWVTEYDTPSYPVPMVEHEYARQRAIEVYKAGIRR